MKKVAIDQMGLIGSSSGQDMGSAVGAPLHLVGGSCIYCGFEIKKPWDLVTHMVEQHEVIDEKCFILFLIRSQEKFIYGVGGVKYE